MTTIGIVGGSGLYALDALEHVEELSITTPFGAPSDILVKGRLHGADLVFLPRHGRGHTLLPSEVPYRANIFALKQVGCDMVLSISAVGSLREDITPGDMVLPDQFVDRTRRRPETFFGEGIVGHVSMADPTSPDLRRVLSKVITDQHIRCHDSGTYVCIEGPAFSTRAESNLYRTWNMDIIGMTAMPEVKLAREAELLYATIALVTDYDCWRTPTADVDVQDILNILRNNSTNIKEVLDNAIPDLVGLEVTNTTHLSLDFAVITAPEHQPSQTKEKIEPLLRRTLS